MELILEMTSDERHLLGESARKSFRAAGGVIGRDPACDWFIPDEKRHLSGRHAVVSHEDGDFYLTDVSTNGVFLNGQDEPLGRERRARLKDADRISMGNMDFIVRLRLDPDAVPYKSESAPGINPVRPVPGGKHLDPLALFREANGLQSPDAGDSAKTPASHSRFSRDEQAVSAPDHQPAANRAFTAPNMLPEDWLGEPVSEPVARPRTPPRKKATSEAAVSVPRGNHDQRYEKLVKQFFKGLGVSPTILGKVDGEKVMEEMGAALKANMVGMVGLMQQRSQLKNEFRMDMTLVKASGNNPLKFSADSKQAMKHLFKPEVESFLSMSESFAECYRDMQLHQLALLTAAQAAMRDVFRVMSPERIEQRADKEKSGLSMSSKGQRCWNKYVSLHGEFIDEDDEFHQVFGSAFVQAYDQKVQSAREQVNDVAKAPKATPVPSQKKSGS